MREGYLQHAYVTRDFDATIAELRRVHGIGPFKEMRDLTINVRSGPVTGHFGLAFLNGTQFEVIAPQSGDVDFYLEALADQPLMQFHHHGRYFPDRPGFDAAMARARDRWRIVVEENAFGGTYAYADARAEFGHYLEYYCFDPDSHFEGVPVY
ncbi:VOC family protein [Stakelama tenebrarum]|uniref:VOC domain-containing protein n=1 Tax=Stakelama tenebrarum TaxID=2711215 RepID=A0A6G6Y757_9SPHN|nr:VOC family protein [Sphingosinithalassobacter tenebrarum]QIG80755.1 hypothetical protein G5C33_13815 [Sphingosinithalassobacter tenebrarum]